MRELFVALCLGMSWQMTAAAAGPAIADAPALAARGPHGVGFRVVALENPAQPDLAIGGLADRRLELAVWYPAIIPDGQPEVMQYKAATPFTPTIDPATLPAEISIDGAAALNAPAKSGQGFPLVIISHGYQNWASMFSYLGEALASKGYVVASIEHRDILPVNAAARQLSFATTVMTRVRDQRFVLDELARLAGEPSSPLHDLYDADNAALVGYSMGGFGAVTTAGAGYDPASPVLAQMPPASTCAI